MSVPLIAVVDNDPSFRASLTEIFTSQGYRVATWSTDVGAYAMVRHAMPNVVLLGVQLDRSGAGRVVLALLRADPHTRDIPIGLCTAHSRSSRSHELQRLGCRTLEKPVDLEELVRCVNDTVVVPVEVVAS
jgi:CheY-like chemotaxis protein